MSEAGSINNRESIQSRASIRSNIPSYQQPSQQRVTSSNISMRSNISGSGRSAINPTLMLDRLLKSVNTQNSPNKAQRDRVFQIQNYAMQHDLDLESHLQKQGDQVSSYVKGILQEEKLQQGNGEQQGINIDAAIMSDRTSQPVMAPRQAWGIKKDEKSHQSTSELPTYSNLSNISSSGISIPNPLYKGSATPSAMNGLKQISQLKAKWTKQSLINSTAQTSSRGQSSSQQQQKQMLSTTIGASEIGTKTPKKNSQQDKLNSSFSSALNQTAKKWMDRKEAREKSQDAQLVRSHKPGFLNSPQSGDHTPEADFGSLASKTVSASLQRQQQQQQQLLQNHNYHHQGGQNHKHHLSMTGYVGSNSSGIGMIQQKSSDDSQQSQQQQQQYQYRQEEGTKHEHKSLSQIRSKLSKMKQISANKENSKGIMFKKTSEQ